MKPWQETLDALSDLGRMTHFWRIRKWHPERFGQPCRVLARGKLNTILIEFSDGYRMTTSRWFVRQLR